MAEEDEEEWDEFEDEFEEDEDEGEEPEGSAPRSPGLDRLGRSVSLGIVAMAPMFLVYELALLATDGEQRNTSELVLFRVFELFGDHADIARWTALVGVTIAALVRCLRQNWALGPRLVLGIGVGLLLVSSTLRWRSCTSSVRRAHSLISPRWTCVCVPSR